MYQWIIGIVLSCCVTVLCANNKCLSNPTGYKVLKHSQYLFHIENKEACFFAFYTTNPEPIFDVRGVGNLGDALWYGYYLLNNPNEIYEFPKPSSLFWSRVCSLEAVSFRPMYDAINRNVTVIGSCDKQDIANYTVPFIFTWRNGAYILDETIYSDLFAVISLTINDLQKCIRSPETCYDVLKDRIKMNPVHADTMNNSFVGKWCWEKNNDVRMFEIGIHKVLNRYVGSYDLITQRGNRIDDNDQAFIFKDPQNNIVKTKIISGITKNIGLMQLTLINSNKLEWRILKRPKGIFDAPSKIILERC